MTVVKFEDTNVTVRRLIDRFNSDLESIGLSYEGALDLMVIQGTVRMSEWRISRPLHDLLDDGDDPHEAA